MKENNNNTKSNPDAQKIQNTRIKYLIQALDIKRDTNMVRIYSAIRPFNNTTNNGE